MSFFSKQYPLLHETNIYILLAVCFLEALLTEKSWSKPFLIGKSFLTYMFVFYKFVYRYIIKEFFFLSFTII